MRRVVWGSCCEGHQPFPILSWYVETMGLSTCLARENRYQASWKFHSIYWCPTTFESLPSIECGRASLDPEAARFHIKETVGKSISQALLMYTSLPRDSLYLLCAFLMGCLWKAMYCASHCSTAWYPTESLLWQAQSWQHSAGKSPSRGSWESVFPGCKPVHSAAVICIW